MVRKATSCNFARHMLTAKSCRADTGSCDMRSVEAWAVHEPSAVGSLNIHSARHVSLGLCQRCCRGCSSVQFSSKRSWQGSAAMLPFSAPLVPKGSEGPPCAGCTEDAAAIVHHHLAVIVHTEGVHGRCKLGLAGQHVGQAGPQVRHLVDVEELGPWYAGSAELCLPISACVRCMRFILCAMQPAAAWQQLQPTSSRLGLTLCRHVPGCVQHLH